MTELWLIRHGQTDWNAENRLQGHTDIPLNSLGLSQARLLADRLAAQAQSFSAVYTSDLIRASQTAQILAERLGLSTRFHPGLREIFMGDWEGLTTTEIRERYADWIETRKWNRLDTPAPNGETERHVAQRAAAAADDIARAHPSEKVLVVSHGITLASLICQARGFPLEELHHNGPENAEPVVIQWGPSRQL